jgi:hypothetical protein
VRLTIAQFLGVLLLLAIAYVVWRYWWLDQDRNSWINQMNNGMMESSGGDDSSITDPPKNKKDGWI